VNSSDAEFFSYQAGGAAWSMGQLSAKACPAARKQKGKGRPFPATLNHVPKFSNVSHGEFFNGRGRSMARRNSSGNRQSYQFWSSSLAQNFDSHLYNDFRRSALDDLFTRHVDHGFNALIDFYRQTLVGHGMIPDMVVDDMVKLSRRGSECHAIVSTTITDALASGRMQSTNEEKVKKSFNTQHGETPEEKLPC
jgi:la-related protein 1